MERHPSSCLSPAGWIASWRFHDQGWEGSTKFKVSVWFPEYKVCFKNGNRILRKFYLKIPIWRNLVTWWFENTRGTWKIPITARWSQSIFGSYCLSCCYRKWNVFTVQQSNSPLYNTIKIHTNAEMNDNICEFSVYL